MPNPDSKTCRGPCGLILPLTAFNKRRDLADGLDTRCAACQAKKNRTIRAARRKGDSCDEARAKTNARADGDAQAIAEQKARDERARRVGSDIDPLTVDDLTDDDVSVGNDPRGGRASSAAAREKRQEYNRAMGENAAALKHAAEMKAQHGGEILDYMPRASGLYAGGVAEQERRFGNRKLSRTISLFMAAEELALTRFKQTAEQYFDGKIVATGYAKRAPNRPMKRSACLLLSDLHIGSELSALDEPMPFGAIQEARRLEYLMRQTCDYKPQYRNDTKLELMLNGDLIDGQLGHQIGAGAPLAEQKAAWWMYTSRMIAEFSAQFPQVNVTCQPGNHGRDKIRHPGRATWRKWDGHEFEMYFALERMCSNLKNVKFTIPFRAVSAVDLHGAWLGLTHGDTEVKLGHPDKAAEANARQLDKINSTRLWDVEFAAWAFGHFHTPRYIPSHIRCIFNGALVPPNGHSRAEGYVREPCGQFLFEAVEGYPIGDVRFLTLDRSIDEDETLGKIIKPFRFAFQD